MREHFNYSSESEARYIPKEWNIVHLGEIILAYQNGIWGEESTSIEKGCPVIRSTEITHDGKIDLSTVAFRRIPPNKTNKYKLKNGDILLVASSGSANLVGRAAIFEQPNDGKEYLFSNFMIRISPKNIEPHYLYFHLNSNRYYRLLKYLQQTSTGLRNLPKKEILQFKIPFPPLPEQKRIAEILLTVDQAIEMVEEAIEKTKRLKKGLMQELLTKGIGHKEFKETEFGKIPKEWDVRKLADIVYINKDTSDPSKDSPNNKFYYIDIDSVENETGFIKDAKEILGKDAPSRARRVIHYDDVIMSTVRPYLKAFALIPARYDKQICSTGFAVFTCKGELFPSYLFNIIFSEPFISQCNKMMVGAQYPALNSSQVSKLKIPLPQFNEQRKIAEILSTVNKRFEILKSKKEKIEKIKKGLMEDLLTGRKRVMLES